MIAKSRCSARAGPEWTLPLLVMPTALSVDYRSGPAASAVAQAASGLPAVAVSRSPATRLAVPPWDTTPLRTLTIDTAGSAGGRPAGRGRRLLRITPAEIVKGHRRGDVDVVVEGR